MDAPYPRVWYAEVARRKLGPFTQPELLMLLRSGQWPWGTMIWRQGMTKWTPHYREFPEVPQPHPTVDAPVEQPADDPLVGIAQAAVRASFRPRYESVRQEGSGAHVFVFTLMVGALALLAFVVWQGIKPKSSMIRSPTAAPATTTRIYAVIGSLEKSIVGRWKLVVTNSGQVAMGEVEVEIHSSRSAVKWTQRVGSIGVGEVRTFECDKAIADELDSGGWPTVVVTGKPT